MEIIETVILAAIQGLLEFVPISSSGHVLVISQLAGWKEPGFIFDSIVHLSSLVAILFYFRRALFGTRPTNDWVVKFDETEQSPALKLVFLLIVAILPIGVAGFILVLTLDSFINFFRTTNGVGTSLIFTALVLFGTSLIKKHYVDLDNISFRSALLIGIAQSIAIIPGVSRSGMTISAGVYLQFKYLTATRFSLLLAIPTLIGTGIVVLVTRGQGATEDVNFLILALAFVVSAITALVSVHIVTFVLRRTSLIPFATYTLIVGTMILFLNSTFPTLFN